MILVNSEGPVTVLGISMCIYGRDFDLFVDSPPEAQEKYLYRVRWHRQRSAAGGMASVHLGWDEAPPNFRGQVYELNPQPFDDLLRK